VIGRLFVAAIRAYQVILRPLLPPACRFYPTCSEYAIRAIQQRGPVLGLFFAARRILRCHPWNPGGYDPLERSTADAAHRAAAGSRH
jgi:putative membrane protein insertion efficiency factor